MAPAITIDREYLRHASAILDHAVTHGAYPNALLAVANRHETVLTHVVPGEDAMALDSIFLLASISKPIIATAIMRLVERGQLRLSIPIATYLPEFGSLGKENVTAWLLLTHTSGLHEDHWWSDFVAACQGYLDFEPGTRFEYCTVSFSVLGELITRISGKPYPQYLRDEIFIPLGMSDTAFQPLDQTRAMPVHDFDVPEDIEQFSATASPGGGLWSTAADLVVFGQTLLRGGRHPNGYRLLSQAAIDIMTQRQILPAKNSRLPLNYAFGWGKIDISTGDLGSERAVGHSGGTGTFFWLDSDWNLVFVFLTNKGRLSTTTPVRALNAVYGALRIDDH